MHRTWDFYLYIVTEIYFYKYQPWSIDLESTCSYTTSIYSIYSHRNLFLQALPLRFRYIIIIETHFYGNLLNWLYWNSSNRLLPLLNQNDIEWRAMKSTIRALYALCRFLSFNVPVICDNQFSFIDQNDLLKSVL